MVDREQQVLAVLDKRRIIGEELRGKIVRAKSWNQLFTTPEEAEADFMEHLVGAARSEYEKNGTLREYRIESHPDGEIHVFVRTYEGRYSTYQRLASGDVVLTFHYPDKAPSVNLISPSIGNIDHPFNLSNISGPNPSVLTNLVRDQEKLAMIKDVIGTIPFGFGSILRGKPAIQRWEDAMLNNGNLPQRIGCRIFHQSILEFQTRFAAVYPQLMPDPRSI